MKLLPAPLAVVLVGVATITTVNAQILANGTFSNDSVLTLAGTPSNEVYGVAFGANGLSNSSSVTTSNGYVFSADPVNGGPANVSYDGGRNAQAGGASGSGTPLATGDPNLATALNGFEVPANGPNALVLNGLTAGLTYNLLVLDDDNRGPTITGNRTFTLTDSNGSAPVSATQQFEFDSENAAGGTPGNPNFGGFIEDTFTATGTSYTVDITQGNGGQLNGLLLETVPSAVPEPSSYTLILLGLGLMALVYQRRGALLG